MQKEAVVDPALGVRFPIEFGRLDVDVLVRWVEVDALDCGGVVCERGSDGHGGEEGGGYEIDVLAGVGK